MIVVITGATKGIGRALANIFAEGGHTIVACARTAKDLNDMQSDFIARFPASRFCQKTVNVGNHAAVKDFAQWLKNEELNPDILVNNAGYFVPGSIQNEAEEMLQKMLDINLFAAYHLTRSLIPGMVKRGSGHIFNICSVASIQGSEKYGAYGISKYALLGFSKNLREELKPLGIKVTAVVPGSTFSGSWEGTDIDPKRIMEENDVAKMVYAASQLSPQAVVEDIVMRPQLGDF